MSDDLNMIKGEPRKSRVQVPPSANFYNVNFMKSENVLKEIENIAKKQFLPIIGSHKAEVLTKLLKKYKPKRCLEIGTLVGYSAIVIAKELPKDGNLVCIEIDRKLAQIAEENISKAGLYEKIEVKIGDAKKLIPKLNGKFDFVFIDALKEEYLDYLKLVEKKLKKGSVIVADNVKIFEKYMENYLDYVKNSGKYKSMYIDVPAAGDGLEVSIKI